jgi:hypothetical protein
MISMHFLHWEKQEGHKFVQILDMMVSSLSAQSSRQCKIGIIGGEKYLLRKWNR